MAVRGMKLDKHPAVLLAVVLFGLALLGGLLVREEVVGQNVYALGVSLGGLPRDDAGKAVQAAARQIEKGPFTFVAGQRSVEVSQAEMSLLLDDVRLIRDLDAYVSSRSRFLPSFLFRLGTKRVVAAPGRVASPHAEKVLGMVAVALTSEPLGARYGFDGRELVVLPPLAGQIVTTEDVKRALEGVVGTRIEVPFQERQAPSGDDVEPLSLTGEFATTYDVKDTDRNVNLSLASEAVHGKMLRPGETYSFNREAGERTADKGYRYANVVVGDHLEPGLAGGICQVTTTLFNAAAIAGLDFPEVHAHGIPVEYVPPGQDAAVAWDYLDIKIRNGTDSAVVFGSWVDGGKVVVRVFGKPSSRTYELWADVRKEYPASGKKPGLLVETYRVEKERGVEVGRTLLMRSEYLPHVPLPTKE